MQFFQEQIVIKWQYLDLNPSSIIPIEITFPAEGAKTEIK